MPKLYVLSGPDVGKSFEVSAGALVGRDPECAVRLRDASVSRHHARVEHDSGAWSILDTQSRNGIHVERDRVPRVSLTDGAEFTLGEVLMRFRAEPARGDAPPASAPADGGGSVEVARERASDSELASARELDIDSEKPSVSRDRASDARTADVADEIVLEGDWEAPAIEPNQATVFASRANVAPTSATSAAPRAAASPTETVANGFGAGTAAIARGGSGGGIAHRTGGAAPANRAVLQYQRVADRPGLFNADIAQQPLWLKLALWLAALAVFAGVFWFAFQGTSFLKSKAQHGSSAEVDENG
jgi:hypothetical protein